MRRILAGNTPGHSPLPKQHQQQQQQQSLAIDSNASGMARSRDYISTSILPTSFQGGDPAFVKRAISTINDPKLKSLSKLQQAVTLPPGRRKLSHSLPKQRPMPLPRTKKARIPVRQPIVSRPGYCENCREKYDDMREHIASTSHRKFATNDQNWVELDTLLAQVQRPLPIPSKNSIIIIIIIININITINTSNNNNSSSSSKSWRPLKAKIGCSHWDSWARGKTIPTPLATTLRLRASIPPNILHP
ncbi:Cdc7p-Dbf4p kinase complex regulatory subunit [Spiromyces aspiralis]|uniref:Cdc7p-Dbf4p kinase complex regulatory subunit n=1 Tax=Spiromyces aspiralis TaxID=68401 RepID=A0ACC1HCT1_9FUNG|nr:Cdc7p-Dbf4p kinase complex regulatory subunit [Spiromyces aspiralis]